MHLGYHGNGRHFELFQPPKSCHTLRWIFLQSFMKGIKKKFKSPFFVSMATATKFIQLIPICFGLPHSTRCGCCSYHVSSISVRRVTYYDPFCVFLFLSIFDVSMATAAIFKKINPYRHNFTWHMIFLQGFVKFDQGISEKSSGQNVWKKKKKKKKKNSEKET